MPTDVSKELLRMHSCWSLLMLLLYRYDGTVRNSAGDVVQFLYGEDGMDGVRIEGQVRVFCVMCLVCGLFGSLLGVTVACTGGQIALHALLLT